MKAWKSHLGLTLAAASLIFPAAADSSAYYKCRPENPYYFSEFNSSSWSPEKELNYEEVYRNYEFFEVFYTKGCDGITVKRYINGQFKSSENYIINTDGSLHNRR